MQYEVNEIVEIGDAGQTIQTPKTVLFDEIAGNEGPERQSLEED